jgi:hypothetical protein
MRGWGRFAVSASPGGFEGIARDFVRRELLERQRSLGEFAALVGNMVAVVSKGRAGVVHLDLTAYPAVVVYLEPPI